MHTKNYDVAVVGLALRVPGADSPQALLSLLHRGEVATGPVPPERARPERAGIDQGGFLRDIAGFDAQAFGLSGREAARMDPQHRLILELGLEALEHAGLRPSSLRGSRGGVFMGQGSYDWFGWASMPSERGQIDAYSNLGSSASLTSSRLAHHLDWRGPALTIDTACASALYALHHATQAIRSGECPLALAGGVNLMINPAITLGFVRASMISDTGRCTPFDKSADGYVRSEGGAVLVLKRLDLARADGDRVYAVVAGSALGHDGRTQGITVPRLEAQVDVIERAWRDATLPPSAARYIEAHGTGTPVGDPIELGALRQVFGQAKPWVGSVKSNLGHLEAAAAAASLAKVTLGLSQGEMPPMVCDDPVDPGPLRLATRPVPLPAGSSVGVSAFGFGGTNAHAVLQAAHDPGPPARTEGPWLVPVSAHTSQALTDRGADWASALQSGLHPDDLAHTASQRLDHHEHRALAFGESRSALEEALTDLEPLPASPAPLLLVFTGMGPQWWGMARELLQAPAARRAIERIDQHFRPLAGWSLLRELASDQARSRVADCAYGQPAIAALQVGLVAWLRARGVEPAAVVGHSAGEMAAAWTAGVLDDEQLARVAWHRSRLQQTRAGHGRLLATGLTEDQARDVIAAHPELEIAALNGASSTALSGPEALLRALEERLEAFARLVPGDVPYHHAQMDPIREELVQSLADLGARAPRLPLFSTVTGAQQTRPMDGDYWFANVRQPVRFHPALQALRAVGPWVALELGPHPVLRRELQGLAPCHSLRRDRDHNLPRMLGMLWQRGLPVDLTAPGRHVPLPAYPWQREPHWCESPSALQARTGQAVDPLLGARSGAGWSNELGPSRPQWASDHRVGGRTLMPAAGIVELLLRARKTQGEPLVVDHVRLDAALCLDEPVQVQVLPGWTVLCDGQEVASARSGTLPSPAQLAPAERARRVPPPYASFHDRGYEYSGSFRMLGQVLLGQDAAEAQVQAPTDGVLAPQWLDAGLQLLLLLTPDEGLYLPVAMDQVAVFGPQSPECTVRVRLRDDRGEIVVLDHDRVVAHAIGVRFHRQRAEPRILRELLLGKAWVRGPEPSAMARGALTLPTPQHHPDSGRADALNALADALWSRALDGTPVAARHQRWVDAMGPGQAGDVADLYGQIPPELHVEAQLLLQVGQALPQLLDGSLDALEVLFPGGDSTPLHRFYAHAGLGQACNEALRRAFGALGPVRVLEVGAGTGSATEHALADLDPEHTDWTLTDISARFFAQAQERLGFDGLRCAVLDLEADPRDQGFAAGSYDVVLMSHVLHALEDPRAALERLLPVLAPGGLVAVLEPKPHQRFLDLIFGATPGWWAHDRARTLQPAARWSELLSGLGLEVSVLEQSEGMDLVFGRVPGDGATARWPRPDGRPWRILGQGALADRVRSELIEAGHHVVEQGPCRGILAFVEGPRAAVHQVLEAVQADQAPALWCFVPQDPVLASALVGLLGTAANEGVVRASVVRLDHPDPRRVAHELSLEPALEVSWTGARRRLRQIVDHPVAPHRGVQAQNPGLSPQIALTDLPMAPCGPRQVRVQVLASGVNFRDVLCSLGMLRDPRLGFECCGRVVQVGDQVTRAAVGDRVVALGPAHRHLLVTDERLVARVSERLSDVEAASSAVVFMTAWHALARLGRLAPGETALIHSAAGGVGLAALQVARHLGARVIATSGTPDKRAWLRQTQGLEHVFDSRSDAFVHGTLEATDGRGVDVVLNALAGPLLEAGLNLLAPHGRFVEIGRRDLEANTQLGLAVFQRSASFSAFDIDNDMTHAPERVAELLDTVLALLADGILRPIPVERRPMVRAREAMRWMGRGQHVGKVVLDASALDRALVPAQPAPMRVRGTWLLTGGLGGVGLQLAEWLFQQGAERLVLVGRRGITRAAQREAVADLRRRGAQVQVQVADVTQRGELLALLESADQAVPLRGVVHTAMVLEDSPLHQLQADSLDRVWDAKAGAALELDRLTRELALELDAFVMISSVAGWVGNRGQAAYNAANGVLDGLAEARVAQGLPGTSLALGQVGQVGWVARQSDALSDRLRELGFSPLPPRVLGMGLAHALRTGAPEVGLCALDWSRYGAAVPTFGDSWRGRAMAGRTPQQSGNVTPTLQPGQAPDQARQELLGWMRQKLARILAVPAERVRADRPLVELGMDSLMEVELRTLLQRELSVELRSAEVVRGACLDELCERALERAGVLGSSDPQLERFKAWVEDSRAALEGVADRWRAIEAGGGPVPESECRTLRSALERLRDELADQVDDLTPAEHRARHAVFREHLGPLLCRSALLRRAHDKPLGYAGDHLIMEAIYQDDAQGTSALDRVLDRFALDEQGSRSVKDRTRWVPERIRERAQLAPGRRLRVANIGCGPARDIHALLLSAHCPPLDLVLVDQDQAALRLAQANLEPLLQSRDVHLTTLCMPVEELVRPERLHRALGERDLVYSSGLFDYFNDASFGRYARALFSAVAPGGQIFLGNISSENRSRWIMEYATDWFVFHRSPEQLLALAEHLDGGVDVRVERDRSGVQLYLVADRPAAGERHDAAC